MIDRRTVLLATLFFASAGMTLLRAEEPTTNALVVKNMHCEGCAKRLRSRLYKLPNVVKVTTNVKQGTAIIVPAAGKTVSPKSVWEATEEENFEIAKLTTPGGTFTSKPKS